MPLRFRIPFVAAFLLLLIGPAHAKEWQPSQPEIMYLQAVAAGDIQKARDLAELGNIDPANIAGHPLAAHLLNAWWGIARPALWRDSVFNYVFVELKQDPNAVPQNQERTVFSTFCQNMLGTTPQDTDATFHRTIDRIHIALRLGAKVTEYPTKHHYERESQPLPTCLDTYEMLPENSPLKSEFLQLIDLYIAKGANPNYRYNYGNLSRTVPLTVAIRHFDIPLLAVLIKNHANPRLTFNAGMANGCGLGQKRISPIDTLIDDIPEPLDRDAPRAEAFLRAFAAAGGDITTPIFTCKHQTKSLKEMAVDDAQIEYARMAMRLEKEPPTAADAPKLPDDFHYGGHTAHDSDDLAAAPSTVTRAPPTSPSPPGSCPGPVMSVQVEADAGKFNPPAWIAPDTTSGSLGIDLRQQWHNLRNQHVALHCMLEPTAESLTPHEVVVNVPGNMTTCTFAAGRMTCAQDGARKGETAKAVSPETGFSTPDTTVTAPNALSDEEDQQLREMVYTMFGGETSQPFTLKSVYHAPDGEVGEITITRATPRREGSCKLALDLTTHTDFPLLARRFDTTLSVKVDFTKATGYRVQYTPEPFSTKGPPKTQIRNPTYTPRNIANVIVYGDGAMCIVGKSPGAGCSTAAMGKTSRNFSNLSPDAQQRAFAAIKKRCPSAPASTASLPQAPGADMVYALYGFTDFKTHTHSYAVTRPDGSPITALTETFTPRAVDACHLRVAYTRRETTAGKPFVGPYDTTYLYDFSKIADLNVDILANPDIGMARLVGGAIKDAPPMVVSSTVVGAGGKCDLGSNPPKCNDANEYASDIHDPTVTPPLLRKAFASAKARCKGP